MSWNIAICDDEQVEIQYLQKIVLDWAHTGHHNISINLFPSSEAFLFNHENDKNFDILLLDIQMGDMDGVELAKLLRNSDKLVQIIFITGFPDFIAEGYEVSALHYLMKPVKEEKLFEVLDKAVSRLQKDEKSLFCNVDGENIRISLGDILYCENFGHNVNIAVKEMVLETKMSFAELEKQLDDTFICCHRSYIVGIRHVKSITKTDVILENAKAIPLSRRLYHETNQAFIKYFKGDL